MAITNTLTGTGTASTSGTGGQLTDEERKKRLAEYAKVGEARMAAANAYVNENDTSVTLPQQEISGSTKRLLELQRKQKQGEMTPQQAQEQVDKDTGDLFRNRTTKDRFTNMRPEAIEAQKEFNKKYGLDPLYGLQGQAVDLEEGVTPRDFSREQAKAQELGYDFLSLTPEEEKLLFEATYNEKELQEMGLINPQTGEIGIQSGEAGSNTGTATGPDGQPFQYDIGQLAQFGLTPERLQELIDTGQMRPEMLQALIDSGQQLGIAQSNLDATAKPTNSMMGVLQEALNAKNNFQEQEIGTSKLFEAAGLSGYSVLAQSLNQRSKEMGDKVKSARALVAETGGAMADIYSEMADHAESLQKQYDKNLDRLLRIDEQAKQNEFAMEKIEMQNKLSRELAEYKENLKRDTAQREMEAMQDRYGNSNDVAGVKYKDSFLGKLFGVGKVGDWCGIFASKVSTAGPVGNMWSEKRQKITHRDNPKVGDKILIPLGVPTGQGSGPGQYGHVAVVTSFDPETGAISVVESNRDGRQNRGQGKGIITMGTYNMNTLNRDYGDDWGFMKGDLRAEFAKTLMSAGPSNIITDMIGGAIRKGAAGALTEGVKGFAEAAEGLSGMSAAMREAEPPLDRYFRLTNDPAVYSPKSSKFKYFDNMTDAQQKKFLDKLEAEERAKEEKASGSTSSSSSSGGRVYFGKKEDE